MESGSSTQLTSTTSGGPPSAPSFSWLGSSPLSWFSTVAASVVGFPVAWNLSGLFTDPNVPALKAGMATLYAVAMYAPMALRGVASVVRAARSGSNGDKA